MLSLLIGAAFVTATPRAGEEALRPDGPPARGTLTLAKDGRLSFLPAGKDTPWPTGDLATIRFPEATPAAAPPPVGFRVRLYGGQILTGRLLKLDAERLALHTAWAERLEVPRAAVVALTHLPGWRTLFQDDLRDGKAWAVVGKPVFDGKSGVLLDEAGQALTYAVTDPPEAGRVGVTFEENDEAGGARWRFEADFEGPKQKRTLRVTVAGAGDAYEVETGGLDGTARRVPRSAGPHRLLVQFSASSLRVTRDEQVLWYNLDAGPGGVLRQVRLTCVGAEKPARTRGAVAWGDCFVARAAEESPRPPGDATQDEVWLGAGDQLFGTLARADGRTLEIEGKYGKRSLPWSEARGCFLRRAAPAPRTLDGAHVRVAFRSGLCAEPDLLDGVVTGLDDKELTLRHAYLGELRLGRDRLRSLQPRMFGKRIEVDNGFHHLGDPKETTAALQPPRAEGPGLRRVFALEAVPTEARLAVAVVQPKGPKDGAGRLALFVNGKRIDDLNRQEDKPPAEPRRLTLPLPKECLRVGDNVLELKQLPGRDGGRPDHAGVCGLVVEIPR